MVRKHIANEHNETIPPSMYQVLPGRILVPKETPIDYSGRLRASDEVFAGLQDSERFRCAPRNRTSLRGKLAAAGEESHIRHEKAQVRHAARWRGNCVAGRGASAAAGNAGDRIRP